MPVTGNQLTKAALLASINADIKNNPVTLIRGDVMAQKIADIEESSVNILTDYSADYSVVVRQTPAGISNVVIRPDAVLGRIGSGNITSIVLFGGSVNQVTVAAAAIVGQNITLSGNQTIDGVVNPATVLVWQNTDPKENGPYDTGAGAWTRMTTADTAGELDAEEVFVLGGATLAGRIFFQIMPSPTPTVDDIVYEPGTIGGNGNSGSNWALGGNNNTPSNNKLGSRNNINVNFVANNSQYMTGFTSGQLGLGITASPLGKLHVKPATASAIWIAPFGTSAGNTGELRFAELAANGTNYIGLKAADALSGSVVYILPSADPTAGQFLKASAPSSGVVTLSWDTISAGGSSLTATQIGFGDGSNLLSGSANLTYASSAVTILNDAIGATSTDGLVVSNTTAATLGTTQLSPRIRLHGSVFNTSGSTASTSDIIIQNFTTQFAAGYGSFNVRHSLAGGAYTDMIIVDSSGFTTSVGNNNTFGTITGSTQNFGANNTIKNGDVFLGNGITDSGSSGTNVAVGIGHAVSLLQGGTLGRSNTISFGYAWGASNSASGSFLPPFAYGTSNTVSDCYIAGALTSGSFATGHFNTIVSGAGVMGQIMVHGSGITMASNFLNSGTFNWGWNPNDTTSRRPSMQFKGDAPNLDSQYSTFNQLLIGTDVTASGGDVAASNVIILKTPSTVSTTGTVTGAINTGGGAQFTVSATMTGVVTGEKLSITWTAGSYGNGTFYYIRNTATTFWLATSQANAIAGTKIAFIDNATTGAGGVVPQQRIIQQLATGTGAIFIKNTSDNTATLALKMEQVVVSETITPDSTFKIVVNGLVYKVPMLLST